MPFDEKGNLHYNNDRQRIHRGVFWTAIVVIASCLVGVLGWQVGWWFKAENTKREVNIINHNPGTQTGWHDEAVNLITQFTQLPETATANRGAVKAQACQLIARLDDPYRDTIIVNFEGKYCS